MHHQPQAQEHGQGEQDGHHLHLKELYLSLRSCIFWLQQNLALYVILQTLASTLLSQVRSGAGSGSEEIHSFASSFLQEIFILGFKELLVLSSRMLAVGLRICLFYDLESRSQ